jgi:hypothetical protein
MKERYMGRLSKEHVPQARRELEEVRARLSELQPADRVYSCATKRERLRSTQRLVAVGRSGDHTNMRPSAS